jgi:hypothetical protein
VDAGGYVAAYFEAPADELLRNITSTVHALSTVWPRCSWRCGSSDARALASYHNLLRSGCRRQRSSRRSDSSWGIPVARRFRRQRPRNCRVRRDDAPNLGRWFDPTGLTGSGSVHRSMESASLTSYERPAVAPLLISSRRPRVFG